MSRMLMPESSSEIISSRGDPNLLAETHKLLGNMFPEDRVSFIEILGLAAVYGLWGVRRCHGESPSRLRRKSRSDCLG